jgi:hypothetical protein
MLLLLVLLIVAAYWWLYGSSLRASENWPTLAYLRRTVFYVVVGGVAPAMVAVVLTWRAVGDSLNGRAAVRSVRWARVAVALFGLYAFAALVWFWNLVGAMNPGVFLAWLSVEVLAFLAFHALGRMQRGIDAAG